MTVEGVDDGKVPVLIRQVRAVSVLVTQSHWVVCYWGIRHRETKLGPRIRRGRIVVEGVASSSSNGLHRVLLQSMGVNRATVLRE